MGSYKEFYIKPEIRADLDRQIHIIANQLIERKDELSVPTLMEGKAGMALLFGYLSKLFPGKNYHEATFDLLNDLSDSLSNDELNHSLSAGIAGIAFTFQHLRNTGILDRSDDLNLFEIDKILSLGINHDFKTYDWDPLHGIIGLGIYYLERNKETREKKYLEKIVDCLKKMRDDKDEFKVWITPGNKYNNNDNYNFGMAHGMPGILSFLAQVHARNIAQHKIEEMIFSCLPFLLQFEQKEGANGHFPYAMGIRHHTGEQHDGSRLAWCYGDLCMANTLIHCGKKLSNDEWTRKGIELAMNTTKRNFQNSGCVDASFCHGSTGLVHQYNRLYQCTGNELFKQTAMKWIQVTLDEYYKPGEGAGGYFCRYLDEQTNSFEYESRYGLLEGSTGIALTYLSWLYNTEPGWDVLFLTNV